MGSKESNVFKDYPRYITQVEHETRNSFKLKTKLEAHIWIGFTPALYGRIQTRNLPVLGHNTKN